MWRHSMRATFSQFFLLAQKIRQDFSGITSETRPINVNGKRKINSSLSLSEKVMNRLWRNLSSSLKALTNGVSLTHSFSHSLPLPLPPLAPSLSPCK